MPKILYAYLFQLTDFQIKMVISRQVIKDTSAKHKKSAADKHAVTFFRLFTKGTYLIALNFQFAEA